MCEGKNNEKIGLDRINQVIGKVLNWSVAILIILMIILFIKEVFFK